jgi:ribosomal protein L16/L10AE
MLSTFSASMLQTRGFVRHVTPIVTSLPHGAFSTCRRALDEKPANDKSPTISFVPKPSKVSSTPFTESSRGLQSIGSRVKTAGMTMEQAIDQTQQRYLVQTGTRSGRTVEVRSTVSAAMSELTKILNESGVTPRTTKPHLNRRLPPNEVLRQKRQQRHRRRFRQGMGRFVELVLRMRRKTYE